MALKWVGKLKTKWGITSNRDFILIMIAFSLAGMMISFCRPPIFHILGITKQTPFWIKALIYIPLIPPIYQVFLLFWGTLLGQFDFFWEKEKRLGRFLKHSFVKAYATVRRN
jgi:hypothetical protein